MSENESVSETVKQLEEAYRFEREEAKNQQLRLSAQDSIIRDKNDEIRELREKLLIYQWLSAAQAVVLLAAFVTIALNWNC